MPVVPECGRRNLVLTCHISAAQVWVGCLLGVGNKQLIHVKQDHMVSNRLELAKDGVLRSCARVV